jgi:hypothetical protein
MTYKIFENGIRKEAKNGSENYLNLLILRDQTFGLHFALILLLFGGSLILSYLKSTSFCTQCCLGVFV